VCLARLTSGLDLFTAIGIDRWFRPPEWAKVLTSVFRSPNLKISADRIT
jgi:hypothetical protein